MKFGEAFAEKYDLSTLKVLGTVGEPINPEAWLWYHKYVGSENCSVVDTYWQVRLSNLGTSGNRVPVLLPPLFSVMIFERISLVYNFKYILKTETGGHVMTPLPGCTPTKPGSACYPFFGVVAVILDESGKVSLKQRQFCLDVEIGDCDYYM